MAAKMMAMLLGLALVLPCDAAQSIEDWRTKAAQIRRLAESDAPTAYRHAQALQAGLPPGAQASDRALVLNLLARIEVYLARTPDAAIHAALALDLARRHDDRIGQAEAYLNISLNAVNEARIKDLVDATTQVLPVLQGVARPDLLGEAFLRTAMMFHRLGKIDESMNMCMQAMEIARRTNDPLVLTYAHQGLAISFSQTDHREEALFHYAQMRAQARAAGSRLLEAYALTALGSAVGDYGDRAGAESMIHDAIALFRSVGTPLGTGFGLVALSGQMRARDMTAEALQLLNEAVDIYRNGLNKIGLWYTLNARSDVYAALGDTGKALADVERGQALAREIDFPLYLSESARRVAALAAKGGNFRRAYELATEAADMTAKAAREKISARVVELAEQYESESKRKQIEELTHRNLQQTIEITASNFQRRWLWTVLFGSLLVLGGTAFFSLRLRRSHHMLETVHHELRVSQLALQRQAASLELSVQARTAELRQQARYLRVLIDALPWRIWLKDTDNRYLAVNQATAAASGTDAQSIIGNRDQDVYPRELAVAYTAEDQDVMATRAPKIIETFHGFDDQGVWTETFKAPVTDEDGTMLGTVGFARDISERKATEAAREAALSQAQQLAHLRSKFLAEMSHELRTPLNGILGYAQILRQDDSLLPRQRNGVDVIYQSGKHLLTLINDILDSTKIEANKAELSPCDVRLLALLVNIADVVRLKARQKHLDFHCEAAAGIPPIVHVDERRLRQALLNLIANAIRFTERGEVRLHVRQTAPGRLRFEVTDTGIGIEANKLDTIFQPLEQANPHEGGTGLGLSISQQLVRLMGGEIRVESQPDRGSTFWFELDVALKAATEDAGNTSPPAAERRITGYEGRQRTALVVDDVAENRAVLSHMLSAVGMRVCEARDGDEAIRQATVLKPDLILMDILMPRHNGREAIRHLRSLTQCRHIPVIAVSASAFEQDHQSSLDAGANAFLPKPVDAGQLLALASNLLDLRWCYAHVDPAPADAAAMHAPLAIPPSGEMAILHELARAGCMSDIAQRAAYLETINPRYRAFASRLRELAEGYQSRALLQLIAQHVEQG
ncbi:response regulator [Cupriavidus necator]|uniref:Virulence sensor protein BvgS n=2 Tax=Cupriavidus necator TaxID=106590 RepID=A0A367PJ47_CUPNE|nr:response regulator [Cupriavidus necator]